jgi:hypothetical protein
LHSCSYFLLLTSCFLLCIYPVTLLVSRRRSADIQQCWWSTLMPFCVQQPTRKNTTLHKDTRRYNYLHWKGTGPEVHGAWFQTISIDMSGYVLDKNLQLYLKATENLYLKKKHPGFPRILIIILSRFRNTYRFETHSSITMSVDPHWKLK